MIKHTLIRGMTTVKKDNEVMLKVNFQKVAVQNGKDFMKLQYNDHAMSP